MPTVASFRRGDTVLVLFPNADLRTAKLRPALVVQADQLNTGIPQIIVEMITSRLDRAGHPSRVKVAVRTDGQNAGLLRDSIIDRQIGVLPMDNVDQALRHTLRL
jgi:mRNA interferase MazF